MTRPNVPTMDALLGREYPLLDHGFIRAIDYMGGDDAVVQAARVSYGAGTKSVQDDRGLIRYLMRHHHTSPFEHSEIKFHMKMPIFVARQFIRHRTANVNEYSARYSILDKEFYIPEIQDMGTQSKTNKQGQGSALSVEQAESIQNLLREDAERAYAGYQDMLDAGLARELARMNLSLNYYTQWYWKVDVHNLMHFLRLRADSHAQYEIRIYADVMLQILFTWMPVTYDAFMDYRLHAETFSRQEMQILRALVSDIPVGSLSGLSDREANEFRKKLEG